MKRCANKELLQKRAEEASGGRSSETLAAASQSRRLSLLVFFGPSCFRPLSMPPIFYGVSVVPFSGGRFRVLQVFFCGWFGIWVDKGSSSSSIFPLFLRPGQHFFVCQILVLASCFGSPGLFSSTIGVPVGHEAPYFCCRGSHLWACDFHVSATQLWAWRVSFLAAMIILRTLWLIYLFVSTSNFPLKLAMGSTLFS